MFNFTLIALYTEDVQISLKRFLILTSDALATKNMRLPVISPPFEILMLKMFHSYFFRFLRCSMCLWVKDMSSFQRALASIKVVEMNGFYGFGACARNSYY